MYEPYLPVLILMLIALGFGGALAIIAKVFGPSMPSDVKSMPYECGMDQISPPRLRFSIQFYRIALLFLVFDIEAAFFFPWAVMFRDLSKGGSLFGLSVMAIFLSILLLALLYVWRRRALEWE